MPSLHPADPLPHQHPHLSPRAPFRAASLFMGLRIDVWLDSDGNATLPRGIALDAADVADVEACAHAAFVEEVVNRLAAQRERRRKVVSR